jgi:predicted secreted protein
MSRNKTLKVGKAENGNIIEVRCGDMIRIELEALGAAGYNWYVDNLNTDFLELMPEITRRAPGEKTGGPVTGVWLFKTKNKGISEIKMDHYRIWEGKEAAIGHFSVKLSIE